MKCIQRHLLSILLMSIVTLTALAQENSPMESVLWKRLSLSKKVSPRVNLSVAPHLFIGDDISRVNLWLTDFGIGYKVNRNVSLKGTYRFNLNFRDRNQANDVRHQLLLDLTTMHKVTSRLKLYYRGRYQTQSPELLDFMNEERVRSQHYFRNRLKARYSVNYYLRPWVSYELFHRLGHRTRGTYLRNDRLLIGVDYRINQAHRLNFYIGIQNRIDRQDRPSRLILGTTFSKQF